MEENNRAQLNILKRLKLGFEIHIQLDKIQMLEEIV